MSDSPLLTIKQFAEKHEAFTEGSLRWLIFCASYENDPNYSRFHTAIHRVGRRVLLDENEFFKVAKTRR